MEHQAAALVVLTVILSAGVAVLLAALRTKGKVLAALREREEGFRAMFDNAAVGMIITDVGGTILQCNDWVCTFLRRARESMIGRGFEAFTAAGEVHEDAAHLARLVSGEIPRFARDKRYQRDDGSIVWANVTVAVVQRDASGTPRRVMAIFQDISERKSLQEDLQRTKDLLELGVRSSDLSIFELDMPDGTLENSRQTLINFWESLGYDLAEAPASFGAAAPLVLTPEGLAQVPREMRAYLNGDIPRFEIEHQVRHKDGSLGWRLARGVALRDARGIPTRFIGSHVDITDKKQVEERLRESEQRWRNLVEMLPQFVFTTGPDGMADYFSGPIMEYTGRSQSELLGMDWANALHPDDREYTQRAWLEAIEQQRPHEVEHRIRRWDGEYRWFTTRAELVRDGAGRVAKWFGTCTDVTSFKELEAELRQAKERLELAIRSSNLSIWEYDMPDGVFADARQTLTNVWEPLGYDVSADAPPAIDAAIHPDDVKRVTEEIRAYLAGESPVFETEHRVRHRDGAYRWILGRGVALGDANGMPVRFVGTSVDITDMKQIEADLERAREAAETANRAKDAFLANVSHEIRTPMNAILGMTELALDSAQTDHQRQLLATVKSAAKSLLVIINDLLDFSKIAAGKLALDVADFSLRSEVGDTLRALAARAHRKGLELICHVHPDVPDALSGDAGRLRQVLMNLVGNAIKFTARGEVVVEVTTRPVPSAADDAVGLIATVRDTGIGIAREKHAAIFRAFEQEDSSTTRKYGGTGLGLTISAQLAALMGGRITVESEPGRGSTFELTARFARASRTDLARDAASPERLEGLRVLVIDDNETNRRVLACSESERCDAARGVRPSGLRILVAEDNELNVALLEELLRRRGHGARFVGDGRTALALACEGGFDLLLLDLHMPEMDGFQVVHAIREAERVTGAHLPIIALTARSSKRDRERCLAAGMDDFLSKPIEAAELWGAVDRAVAAAPAKPRASRLLDPRAITRACGGRAPVVEKLCQVFRRSLPGEVAHARSALGERDLTRLREAAHTLYGTLAPFSTIAGAAALTLEEAALRDDAESCTEMVGRLEAMCTELLEDTRALTLERLRP